jgi:hypothetical protein
MPFKSKAQRRKFAELLVKGEISEETYEEWNRSTGGASLPERVRPKRASKSKAKKAKKARPKKPARTRLKSKAKRR